MARIAAATLLSGAGPARKRGVSRARAPNWPGKQQGAVSLRRCSFHRMSTPREPRDRQRVRVWFAIMAVIATSMLAALTIIFLAMSGLVPSSVGSFGFTAFLVTSVPLIIANRFVPKVVVNANRPRPINRRWVWAVVGVTWGLGALQVLVALIFLRWPWPGTLLFSGGIFIVTGAIALWMTHSKATLTNG